MPNDTYALADEDLWGPPLAAAPRATARLLAEGAAGLHVFAPDFVSLARRSTVPLLVAHVGVLGDTSRVRLAERTIVVAVDVDRDVAIVHWEGTAGAALPAPPNFAGAREAAVTKGRMAEALSLELAGHPGVGWLPGRVVLTTIVGDETARHALTVGETVRVHDAAVDQALAQDAAVWPPPGEGNAPPSYTRFAESPAVPEAPGIALSCSAVVLPHQGARAMLFGAFRTAPRARRNVPITLVLTGASDPTPHVLRMRVPSEGGATGHFAIDLLTLVPLAFDETYFVHAFSGEATSSVAARLTLVSEARAAVTQATHGYQAVPTHR